MVYGDDVCSSSELQMSSMCARSHFFLIIILREMWAIKKRNRK